MPSIYQNYLVTGETVVLPGITNCQPTVQKTNIKKRKTSERYF